MQAALRRWLVPRTTRDDLIIREQNLRVMLLVLLPLAILALLSQLTEWVVSGIIFIGVPISAFSCVALLLLTALTHNQRPVLAQWLLVLMLVPIAGLTTFAEGFTEAYNILEVVIAVTLSAILLARWAIFITFALTFGAVAGVGLLLTKNLPPTSGPVVLVLFAYSAITIPLVMLVYYLRLLFDRQISLLQSANQQTRIAGAFSGYDES